MKLGLRTVGYTIKEKRLEEAKNQVQSSIIYYLIKIRNTYIFKNITPEEMERHFKERKYKVIEGAEHLLLDEATLQTGVTRQISTKNVRMSDIKIFSK